MSKLDYSKISKISKSNNYKHSRVSSPVPAYQLDANILNTEVSTKEWDSIRKESVLSQLKKIKPQKSLSKKAFYDMFSPKVVESSHVAHAEVLEEIEVLNDPKRVVKVDPSKYLYTHATIISSVNLEDDDHTIKESSIKDINKNGDAWETGLLLGCYKTFVGAYNYLEHVQVPAMKKGWIIDAVPRLSKNEDGSKFAIVDILVATDRTHKTLIHALENKELNTLSMGCEAKFTVCSKCAYISSSDNDTCEHIPNKKLSSYVYNDGSTRYIAELCGHKSAPDSVTFIEASWVYDPAFITAEAKKRVASSSKRTVDVLLEELTAERERILRAR